MQSDFNQTTTLTSHAKTFGITQKLSGTSRSFALKTHVISDDRLRYDVCYKAFLFENLIVKSNK